jgi:aspartyl-tRNA(Asn)/glutamyl-tRNA(Gln) amidotransferase subunit A
MVNKSNLTFQSLVGLKGMLSSGEIDAHDILDSYMDRIRRLDDSSIHAFLVLSSEQTLRQEADAASRALKNGNSASCPLAGIPIAIKDNTFVAGLACTAGSKILGKFIPKSDAPVTKNLRKAGAIVVGKTSMHEFAYGVTNNNPHYGPTHNPWNLELIPGGSSGGSAAAVAAGFVPASIGTDTGGSVRIPSALCGVVGLKPTRGSLNKSGIIPLSWTLDHVGVLARNAQDVGLLFDVLKEKESGKDNTPANLAVQRHRTEENSLKGVRIGIPRKILQPLDDRVAKVFEQSLDKLSELGASVTDIDVPQEWVHIPSAFLTILLSEASAYHEKWVRTSLDAYGQDVRSLVQAGYPFLATQYMKAQQARQLITEASMSMFKTIDVLALPTVATVAPRIGEEMVQISGQHYPVLQALSLYTLLFNFTGQPAISIPNGFVDGLPTGLQLVAAHWREADLIKITSAFQGITDFHIRQPIL